MQGYDTAVGTDDELLHDVGLIAECLARFEGLAARDDSGEVKALLEQALVSAAEMQQRLAAQQERIEKLEALSPTDELTGVLNRRGFMAHFARAMATARRAGGGGILAIIDVDDLKAINDRLGHLAGDAVLKRVAAVLTDNVRESDVVARIGGDEFAVLLSDARAGDGVDRCRDLERIVNNSEVVHENVQISLRASFGVERYCLDDTPEEVIARADSAMYCDKRKKPRYLRPWKEYAN